MMPITRDQRPGMKRRRSRPRPGLVGEFGGAWGNDLVVGIFGGPGMVLT